MWIMHGKQVKTSVHVGDFTFQRMTLIYPRQRGNEDTTEDVVPGHMVRELSERVAREVQAPSLFYCQGKKMVRNQRKSRKLKLNTRDGVADIKEHQVAMIMMNMKMKLKTYLITQMTKMTKKVMRLYA